MGTSTAPSTRVAKSTTGHSQRFSASSAIRSPLTMPQLAKALARVYTRATSSSLDMGCHSPDASCHSTARSRLLAATSVTTSTRVSRLNMNGHKCLSIVTRDGINGDEARVAGGQEEHSDAPGSIALPFVIPSEETTLLKPKHGLNGAPDLCCSRRGRCFSEKRLGGPFKPSFGLSGVVRNQA